MRLNCQKPRRGPNVNNNHNNSGGKMGANKVVRGIAWPVGMHKLYTGSKDETEGFGYQLWSEISIKLLSCVIKRCQEAIAMEEVGLISKGPWLLVGIPNVVKAWNTQTNQELSLSGPVGQVYTMVVGNDLLFAGTQDGTILAWKFNHVTNSFEPAASLKGHTLAVVSLVVGANRLYSGSMDHSIK
ncbi:hypothetical protein CRYUN_Cryun13aG0072100 [Craigia yunnanensis]